MVESMCRALFFNKHTRWAYNIIRRMKKEIIAPKAISDCPLWRSLQRGISRDISEIYSMTYTILQSVGKGKSGNSFNYLQQRDEESTKVMKKSTLGEKVQVGKDQEKAQSEKDSHSKNRGGKTRN